MLTKINFVKLLVIPTAVLGAVALFFSSIACLTDFKLEIHGWGWLGLILSILLSYFELDLVRVFVEGLLGRSRNRIVSMFIQRLLTALCSAWLFVALGSVAPTLVAFSSASSVFFFFFMIGLAYAVISALME